MCANTVSGVGLIKIRNNHGDAVDEAQPPVSGGCLHRRH